MITNIFNIYNELVVTLTFIFLLVINLTEVTADVMERIGWSIIGMIFGSLLVTWFQSLTGTIVSLFEKSKDPKPKPKSKTFIKRLPKLHNNAHNKSAGAIS